MLNLDNVKDQLKRYHYQYDNNVVCGHSKAKVKAIIPAFAFNQVIFEEANSCLVAFDPKGISIFIVNESWQVIEKFTVLWTKVDCFKIKKGLLEDEIDIETIDVNIKLMINKFVVNNSWVKANYNELKANNFYYHK